MIKIWIFFFFIAPLAAMASGTYRNPVYIPDEVASDDVYEEDLNDYSEDLSHDERKMIEQYTEETEETYQEDETQFYINENEEIDYNQIQTQIENDERLLLDDTGEESEQAYERLIQKQKIDIREKIRIQKERRQLERQDPCETAPNSPACLLLESYLYEDRDWWHRYLEYLYPQVGQYVRQR